jgi:hypothetical protein
MTEYARGCSGDRRHQAWQVWLVAFALAPPSGVVATDLIQNDHSSGHSRFRSVSAS